MDKAYDLRALGEKIIAHAKSEGLAIAEEAVEKLGKAVYTGTTEWLQESATLSTNPIDNMIVPLLDYVDDMVEKQIAKIDLDGDGD